MDPVITTVAGVLLVWAIIATIIALRSKTEIRDLAADNGRLTTESQQNQSRLKAVEDDAARSQRLKGEKDGVDRELAGYKDLLEKSERARKEDQKNAGKELEALQKEIRDLAADKRGVERDLENTEKKLEEQGDIVKEAKEAFKVLSTQTLEQQHESADRSLKARQEAVEKLVKPLTEKIDSLDKARIASATEFREQMRVLSRNNENLASEAEALSNALKRPEVRGTWGETQLERVLEISGLKKDIDYTTQDSFTTEEGRLRPDVIVRMPEDRVIALDSKVSMSALFDAFAAEDEATKNEALGRHVESMKKHIDDLNSKRYWDAIGSTPEMVVMVVQEFAFLPAVELDPELTERALRKNVLIVTPTSLLALLKAVELTWQQIRIVETAQQVSDLGKQMRDRLATFAEHYVGLGGSLKQAVDRYNRGVGSWDTYLATSAMRFKELNVPSSKELPVVNPIDASPNSLQKLVEAHEMPALTDGDGRPLSGSNNGDASSLD